MPIRVITAGVADGLDMLAREGIESLITDPPYSDHVHANPVSNSGSERGQSTPVPRDLGFSSLDGITRSAISRVASFAARWAVVFSDIESSHLWRDALVGEGLEYVRTVPWVRWSQPQLSGDRPPSGCELVTLAHRPLRKHWSGPGNLTQFSESKVRAKDKFPCEKPLDLMLSLVSYFSDAGGLVCDPCCGSGTTGLACRILGRDAVMLEVDPVTADLARAKIEGALSKRDLDRVTRWVIAQDAWLSSCPPPASPTAEVRYARARADTAMAARLV